ncbi:AT-rich interactive domain-containing protein 5B-like isoform X2 [Scyliorhinus canicula]|nr:AT-rich interactive domain-containing protein 5B-like isoform X2 [Scyliorhinus canicula]XP_038641536.1 AT-rich interactive domain-containing protein 5B-like isoform X2 [Scyliorhinus canicula]XP_038641537.1 AT-rich interactive domain-containing protein 5B-like isoform X2 [Scyliorhinus canicula]
MKGEENKPLPAFKPRKQYNVIRNKEGKGSSIGEKERSKRKRPKDSTQQSNEPNGILPQVLSEDVGKDKTEQISLDKESPNPRNTTTGSEDSKEQPLNGLSLQNSCGTKSPMQDVTRASENGISEEVRDANGPSSEAVSKALMGNKVVGHNGHCVTADLAMGLSEEMSGGDTAVCEDDRDASHQPQASMASKDECPAQLSHEVDKSRLSMLRSKRDQEIMSPLAKKKFLAQGNDATSLSFNTVGIASTPAGAKSVQSSEVQHSPPASGSTPEVSIHRPTVIHHIQPPRQGHLDYHLEWPFGSTPANYHVYSLDRVTPFDGQKAPEERDPKGRAVEHSHAPQGFGNFCCSPYMHGLVKPFFHYPNKGSPFDCCTNQRSFRELSSTAVPTLTPDAHKLTRHYGRTLASNDQPTDLSLPRTSAVNTHQTQVSWVTETKSSSLPLRKSSFTGQASSSSDSHPKACWVPPISVALPRRVPAKRAKSTVLPTNVKSGPPSCLLSQPTQRSQKELDAAYGKKLRIVSPLLIAKDLDGKDSQRISDGKDQKSSLPDVPTWLPTTLRPQDPAFYEGVRTCFPASYGHHLSHVKSPTLYSPYMPSFTVNSFMVPAIHGQVLSSPGYPLDLYKHLAAGSSYENLLRHRLYSSPHLTSFNAGHKL